MVLLDTDYYGNKVAVAKESGEVSIYLIDDDGNAGNQLAIYENAHSQPTTVHWGHPRFSPCLLSAGLDGLLNVYSMDSNTGTWGACERLTALQDGILDAKFSPEKFGLTISLITFQDLIIFTYDEIQQAWLKFSKTKVSKLGNACISWDSDTSRVAVAGRGGTISIFEVDFDKKEIQLIKELFNSDYCYKNILWNGEYILAFSETGKLVCWQEIKNSESNESTWKGRKMPDGFNSKDTLISFDPLGKIAIVSEDDSIKQLRIGVEEVYIIPA